MPDATEIIKIFCLIVALVVGFFFVIPFLNHIASSVFKFFLTEIRRGSELTVLDEFIVSMALVIIMVLALVAWVLIAKASQLYAESQDRKKICGTVVQIGGCDQTGNCSVEFADRQIGRVDKPLRGQLMCGTRTD